MLNKRFFSRKELSRNIKTEIVKMVIRPTLTYSSETWTMTERQINSINAMEIRFIRKIENKTRRDRIRNEIYRSELQITKIKKKNGKADVMVWTC